MNHTTTPNQSLYGLVDWLVLSGITAEVGEISAYQALQQRQQAKNPVDAVIAEEPKTAAAPQKKIQQKHELKQFNSMEELNDFCTGWKDFALAKTASRCVVGQGNTSPTLLIVTDMPEDEEDRTGIAFSSQTNQLVKKALSFTDIPADQIYFSYLSKWRSPGKRSLSAYEMEVCSNLLQQEIRLLAPGFVLTLGESTREVVLNGDNVNEFGKLVFGKIYNKQIYNKNTSILASQKCEFLVKNPTMKKTFWLGLLELAAAVRNNDRSH
jgi:uracil-DNA glycosylase family 4